MTLDVMRVSVGPDLRDLLVRVELDHIGVRVGPFFTCQRAFNKDSMKKWVLILGWKLSHTIFGLAARLHLHACPLRVATTNDVDNLQLDVVPDEELGDFGLGLTDLRVIACRVSGEIMVVACDMAAEVWSESMGELAYGLRAFAQFEELTGSNTIESTLTLSRFSNYLPTLSTSKITGHRIAQNLCSVKTIFPSNLVYQQ